MYTGNEGLFHIIEGAQVIVRKKHVFKQRKVYRRGNDLFVGECGGFVSLRREGRTAEPDVSWDYIEGVNYRIAEGLLGQLTLAA